MVQDSDVSAVGLAERTIPRIISVDDHITEPPTMFERWLPQKYLDRAPHVERRHIAPTLHGQWGTKAELLGDRDMPPADVWFFGEAHYLHRQGVVIRSDQDGNVGFTRDNVPVTYEEMRPGCYDPKARLADMDLNHVGHQA
jgi:hypothetical protein